MRVLLSLALAGALPAAATAQYQTICQESFEYAAGSAIGGLGGGGGWSNVWYGGPSGDAVVVTSPGFDGLGEKGATTRSNDGAYRTTSNAGFNKIVENGQFGADGSTVWVSFWCRRAPGSSDDYGGLSLFIFFGGEKLFLGSPSFTNEWGLHDVGGGASSGVTVSGSSADTLAYLVYRVDFLPGAERVRLWIDPATPKPTTPAQLDTTVADFRFNEIRLQSGNPAGATTGFEFDAIAVETPDTRPVYGIGNLVGGQTASIDVTNCAPGNTVLIGYSLAGPGPVTTPLGNVSMSPPITQLPPQVANASGEVHLSQTVPVVATGRTVYSQCAELYAGGGGGLLSNPLALVVQ